ncbi:MULTISPECIES: hypothetical protein [Methylorubrum]|uniref:Uncharacterized protein n=2 Tax=Methylorubrum TaxID=2282523 RepID=A0A833N1B5_9HYPH|nr:MULTISPECIES: hypothetical protein [Methylorubrum]KAB7787222.1 hypothetical protein F8B43_0658 [Methylorubrum populi]MBA8915461.1 hypothetical protein [Methylorubrum thiocyanatum]GJE81387.1 hypothetical protein CJNNKLLH_2739 [Methylorubrum thiocyanatum]
MPPSKTSSLLLSSAPTAPAHRDRTPTGSVVPFAPATTRRFRREADDAPRGQILLFTGVRYERMPDAEALPVPRRRRS